MYLAIGQILTYILSFATTVILARTLNPDGFGILTFAGSFISYFAILASFGINGMAVPELTKDKEIQLTKINKILSFKIVLTIISFLLLLVILPFINKPAVIKLTILTSGISLFISSISIEWVFTAMQEMKFISISNIINSFLYALLIVIGIWIFGNQRIYIIPIFSVIASAVANIYLFLKLNKKIKYKYNFNIKFNDFKYLILQSYPFLFSGVFALFNTNIDMLIIGFVGTGTQLGLYSCAYKFVGLCTTLAAFIYRPVYPIFSKSFYDKDYNLLDKTLNQIRRIIYIIALPIASVTVLLSKDILKLFFGEKYIDAWIPLIILMIFVALYYVREIYGYALMAWGQQKKYMKIVMYSSTVNIVGNLVLIPVFGIIGASVATLISEIINLTCMFYQANKTYKIKYENGYVFKIIVSNLFLMIIIVLMKYFNVNLILIMIIVGIVYLAMLFLLRVIDIKEIKTLISKK